MTKNYRVIVEKIEGNYHMLILKNRAGDNLVGDYSMGTYIDKDAVRLAHARVSRTLAKKYLKKIWGGRATAWDVNAALDYAYGEKKSRRRR